MLANIRIATIVGLVAIVGLVNAAELKNSQEEETKRFLFGCHPKPRPPLQSGRGWANDWDGYMHFSCPPGTAISSMFSVWDPCRKDRIWSFSCRTPISGLTRDEHGTWDGGFINEWDGPLVKICDHNAFICGIRSEHDNYREDRRFKFRCCTAIPQRKDMELVLTDCTHVKLNNFQTKMDYNVKKGRVLQGLNSEHRNDKEDREWYATICRVKLVRRH